MTTDIIEGNKLIRLFEIKDKISVEEYEMRSIKHLRHFEDLNYHTSFDSLMDAWKKFYNEVINTEWYKDYYTQESAVEMDCLEYSLVSANIDGAFKHFVSLLKWYNKNKNQ